VSLSFARSARRAVLALAVVLSLGPLVLLATWPERAGAQPPSTSSPAAGRALGTAGGAATAALALTKQTPWVTPEQPHFSMQVAVGSRAAAQGPLALALTVYHRLITRTGFAQALTSTPGGAALERVTPVPVGAGNLSPSLDLTVGTGPPSAAGPSIGLNCAGSGTCPGVYPVSVTLEQTGGTVLGQFNTFLTYEQSASSNPLRFALVVPFAAGVHVLPGSSNAATALAAPSRQAVDNLAGFARTLAARATVPITVLADPHTVQALQVAGSTEAHQALATLSSLSQNPAGTEFPSTPYVPVDLGALAAAGLTGEIVYQMKVGAAALTKAAIHTDPAGTTWVATGGVTGSLATGMSDAGVNRVVVPDTAITTDPGRLGITQPFELSFARDTTVTAAVSDSGLEAHFSASSHDPVLAAQQMLADLAFIQSEQPGSLQARGVTAISLRASALDPAFVDTLLAGLENNPAVRAVTLDQFFNQVPVGGNAAPTTRQPVAGARSDISASAAVAISRARQRNDAFHSAVVGSPPVLGHLDDLLLASEGDGLGPSQRQAAVATYERSLGAQLSLIQLSTDRAITLTSRTGRIPITFLSSAPYALVGDVALSSDKFQFPQGSTRSRFAISRSTNPLPIEVQARTSGDLPLAVTLTAPKTDVGAVPLVIAHGELTVRSTATSVVGVVLTLLAIAVLVAWWARTWRRGRRARAGRGGAPS